MRDELHPLHEGPEQERAVPAGRRPSEGGVRSDDQRENQMLRGASRLARGSRDQGTGAGEGRGRDLPGRDVGDEDTMRLIDADKLADFVCSVCGGGCDVQ